MKPNSYLYLSLLLIGKSIKVSSFAGTGPTIYSRDSKRHTFNLAPQASKNQENELGRIVNEVNVELNRRNWVKGIASSASAMTCGQFLLLQSAEATFTTSKPEDGAVSPGDLANKLRAIPTFSLVDPDGVPFFVFGEDAKVTSYFFIDYDEAARILEVAKTSSDKAIKEAYDGLNNKVLAKTKQTKLTKEEEDAIRQEVGSNPWVNAKITTVPLDTAVTLATKASSSKSGGIHFQVAASSQDIEDAMNLEGLEDMAEGKVPLFYFESFEKVSPSSLKTKVPPSTLDGLVTPLYFTKSQLIQEYQSLYPDKPVPQLKTTELFATLTQMVKPISLKNNKETKKQKEDKEDLQSIVFIPPLSSARKAEECQANSPSYKIGQSIIVL